jgi:hypothetical protein
LGTNVLKLHDRHRKAEGLLAIELRSGKGSLDAFLFHSRATSVLSPLWNYNQGQQTAKYVLIFCSQLNEAQYKLRDKQGHLPEFLKLLRTAEGLQKSTK